MKHLVLWLALLLPAALTAQAQLVQQAASGGSDLADLGVTLPQLPAPGNVLVICHDSTSGGLSSIEGGGVSNWVLCASTLPAQDNSETFVGVVGNSPSRSINIALGGSPNSACAVVSEWRGLAVPLQFTASALNGNGSVVPGGTLSLNPGDVMVATTGVHAGSIGISAASNGFVDFNRPPQQSSSAIVAAYKIATASGPLSTSWTLEYDHLWASTAVALRAGNPPVSGPALVQRRSNSSNGPNTLSVNLNMLPTLGNLLVVCHESSTTSKAGIQGGGVTAWQLFRSSLPTQRTSAIWLGIVDAAPSRTLTIHLGGSSSAMAVASEWQGFHGMPRVSYGSRRGSDGTSSSPVTTGAMSARAGDLLIGAVGVHVAGQTISPVGSGFTGLGSPVSTSGGVMAAAYRVPTQDGPAAATWTLDFASNWTTGIVVLHP